MGMPLTAPNEKTKQLVEKDAVFLLLSTQLSGIYRDPVMKTPSLKP